MKKRGKGKLSNLAKTSGLEESLQKVSLEVNQIIDGVQNYYQEEGIESPGVESKDFAETILPPAFKAAEKKA